MRCVLWLLISLARLFVWPITSSLRDPRILMNCPSAFALRSPSIYQLLARHLTSHVLCAGMVSLRCIGRCKIFQLGQEKKTKVFDPLTIVVILRLYKVERDAEQSRSFRALSARCGCCCH
jgi:hypothetical protein